MLKVVLDTGVFVSGFSMNYHGSPAQIVEKFIQKELHVVTSKILLVELERVLHYPRIRKYFKYSDKDIIDLLRTIKDRAEIVEPRIQIDVIKEDL